VRSGEANACDVAGIVLAPLLRRHGRCRLVAASGCITGSLGYALCFSASSIFHLYVTFGIIAGTPPTYINVQRAKTCGKERCSNLE